MVKTKHVDFIDQTLRDGPQSLWGMTMQAHDATDALPHLARAGYRTIDLFGAGSVTVAVRAGFNPWDKIDYIVAGLPHNELRSGLRTISAGGFVPTPQVILDLWIQTVVRHGMKSMWLYDCLFDMELMKHMAGVVTEAGGIPVPAVMYGLTSVHDDAFFADRAAQMATWEGVESIYVEDAAGLLTPERARTLLPALRAATGSTPLEAHFHNTTSLAPHNYMIALESGFERLHTASRPMANGPSLPSTEAMVTIVEHMGYSHSLDSTTFAPVAENFHRQAVKGGHRLGVPAEYDPRVYDHQLPGGMTGTLINQLAKQKMSHRFEEVLEAIPQVRRDLGEPIMATPFSQLVGIQAVMNIITGDPYSMVPDEVVHYALGHYGPLAAPMNPDVQDRIMATPRAKQLENWERPNPTLKEIKHIYGASLSDEDLLLRFLTSDEEVDKLKGFKLRTDPRTSSNEIVNHVVDLIAESRPLTSLRVTGAGSDVTLRRSGTREAQAL